jgi:glutathione S-transferase
MDRFFDNYVMTAMQKPVSEALRAGATRKEEAMAEARQALDTAYAWLEERLSGRTWAAGEGFTMNFLAALIKAVPRIHTVLTDNGSSSATAFGTAQAALLMRAEGN